MNDNNQRLASPSTGEGIGAARPIRAGETKWRTKVKAELDMNE